jgi:murein DD-endopeptidase MepM/ murein hydrolase activator NlpD
MWQVVSTVVVVAVVAGVAWLADSLPEPPLPLPAAPPVVAYAPPTNAREAWAVELLGRLGNAQPTGETVAMVVEWTLAEDGSMGAFDRNNPLNTTICGHNFVGAINNDGACGVAGYATRADGLDATVDTITQANFASIAAALQVNDPEQAKRALWASPWASSHYGGGVGWPEYTIAPQNGAQRATGACPVSPCWLSGRGYGPGHPGIDLGATLGQPVYATMGGTAALSTTWPCGNGVMVTQGDTQTLMCHLSGFAVSDGATVQAGDVVGYAGESGEAFGVHVHYEIRIGGVNADPSEVLR